MAELGGRATFGNADGGPPSLDDSALAAISASSASFKIAACFFGYKMAFSIAEAT